MVVVNDGGSEDLEQAIASFDRSRLHMMRQARRGPGAARNTGARSASGRWLAFTDDDCLPEPGWLHALAHQLDLDPNSSRGSQRPWVAGVGGNGDGDGIVPQPAGAAAWSAGLSPGSLSTTAEQRGQGESQITDQA